MVLRLKTRESRSLPGLPNATLSSQHIKAIARSSEHHRPSANKRAAASGLFALMPKTKVFCQRQKLGVKCQGQNTRGILLKAKTRGILLKQKPGVFY
jgi:hypothetical protein